MSGLKASNGVPQKPGGKSRLPRTSSSSSKAMSSKPGDREVTKMNLMAVRKSDSYATEIISTVPQVVVYKYEGANNTWERTSVEGTLFIYSRKAGPGHAFVVLNRLNSGNTQEMVSAGMTFRVQQPFILFKKHSGDIFGLCVQDEKVCEETGQLLSRLAAGLSNGYSGQEGGSSIAAGRRTKSTPVFKRDDNVKLDVNEYLESSGMNYLGQTFSDDTSSQDSLNSEPITFTPKPPKPSSTSSSSSSSSQGQTKPARSGSRSPVKARTKGAAKNSTPKPFSSSSSSKPASTAQRKSVGLVEVTAHSPTFNKRSSQQQQQQPSESRHKRENFQHASSFDSAGGGVKGGSKENGGSLPGSRSSSPLETGKPPQKKAVSSSLNVTSGSPLTVSAIPPSSLSDHSDNIVRKLFSSEPSSSEHTAVVSLHQISSSISSGPHPVSSTSSALASGSPLPLQAISLDEVEKQMKEEAPSPDIAAPFSLFGSASAGVRSNEASLNLSSGLGGETVLLQPSVFSTAPPSNPTSSPHGLTTLASMPQGTGNNQLQQHFSTAQRQQYGHDTAPGLVSISVQPPTPLPLQHHQGLPASLSLQAQQQQPSLSSSSSHHVPPTTVASSFPPIPPLIHAPGMRAAPLTSPPTTHNETQQEERKENQQTLATSSHANNMPSNTPNPVSNRHYSPPPPSTTSATHQHTTCTFPSAVVMKPGRTYSDPSVLSHYSAVGRNPAATSPPPPGRHYSLAGSSTAGIMLSPLSEISIPQAPVPNPAALMSPMQFASHQQGEGSGTSVAPGLSREQMQQGLIYLIQNDATFMDTLHKAYQLSLSDQR